MDKLTKTPTTSQPVAIDTLQATDQEMALLRQAAWASHQSLSEFVLKSSIEEAKKVLSQDHSITVSPEVFETLREELDKPV